MKNIFKTIIPVFAACGLTINVSAQDIDSSYLESLPAVSVADAISGMLPWMDVTYLAVRGTFSTSGTAPLVIVDGVEMPLDLIDPSVVESVKVITDASASAIYGARAAAGAIVVTTKNAVKLLSSDNSSSVNAFTGVTPAGKACLTQNYKVTTRGGNEGFSYFFGGNYYGREGSTPKEDGHGRGYNKIGMTSNMNARINSWLRYSLGVDYTFRSLEAPIGTANPQTYSDEASHYMVMRNNLSAHIAKGLDLRAMYAFTNHYDFARERSDIYSETRIRESQSQFNVHLDYDHTFAESHHVSACVGADIESGMQKLVSAAVGNLINPAFSVLTIGDGKFAVGESKGEFYQAGFFANANYDYNGIYTASLTFREDGSSRFAPAHRWAPSFSASLGYNGFENIRLHYSFATIANQSIDPLYAYYASINTNAGDSPFLFDRNNPDRYSSYNYPVTGDLRAERVTTNDIGGEASFLDSRLNVQMDMYVKHVSDMINPNALVSAVIGTPAPLMNQGSATSCGFDLAASWADTIDELKYNVKLMYSDHTPVVRDLPDPRHSVALLTGVSWRGLECNIHFNGIGSYGMFCLRNFNVGYDIPLATSYAIKGIKVGLSARNIIYMRGQDFPMSVFANVNIRF